MSKNTIISQDAAMGRLSDALRLRVGRGRRYSFSGLSEATGIAERTLESYARGENAASFGNLLALFSVLGPSFASDVICISGLIAREGTPDEPQHKRLLSGLTGMSALLAEALEDGYVNHQEDAALRAEAQKLMTLIEPLFVNAPVRTGKGGAQ